MQNKTIYPVYLSDQKFSGNIDLLLISDEFKSHYICIKDFDKFMFGKTKNKGKKYFCRNCLQCFSSGKILIDHKEDCLVINGRQNVKFKSGTINFRNYFKQIPVPFKIYADFECILKKVDCEYHNVIVIVHTQENIKIIFLVVLLINLCVLIINIVRKLFCADEKMLSMNLLKQFLVNIIIVGI